MTLSRIIATLCLLLAINTTATQADAQRRYATQPANLDGSMALYDFNTVTPLSATPDSLTPFHAEYIARHGARFLSSQNKTQPLMEALVKARQCHHLSSEGMEFMRYLQTVEQTNNGRWGDLSPIGSEEERLLANRIFSLLPNLALDAIRVNAISSYVPRVVASMYDFTSQLSYLNDQLDIATDEGPQYNTLLRPFEADTDYARYRKDGDWMPVYEDFVERYVSPIPALRLINEPNLTDTDLRNLTMMIYGVLSANRAAGLPAPTTQWLSEKEYAQCWAADNLQRYLRNCVSPLSTLPAKAASPLLHRIISAADKAAAQGPSGTDAVNAYFGHAETLLPLLSLMKLNGAFALPLDWQQLAGEWKVQDLTPLAANLIIILSKAPSGTVYATLQLNGKTIPPYHGAPETVPWNELRDHWLQLLAAYNP